MTGVRQGWSLSPLLSSNIYGIPVGLTAVARELLAIIWEVGQETEQRHLQLAS